MDVTLPVTLRYPSAQSATFTSSNQLLSLVTLRDAMSQSPQSQQSPSTSLDKSVQTRYVTPCHAVSHVASHSLHSHLPVVKSRYVKPRHTVSVYAPSFLVVTPSSRCPSSLSHTPVTLSRLLVLLSHLLVSLSHPVSRCHTLATLFLFLVTPPCLVMPPCLVVTFLSRGHASLFRCLTSSPRCLTSARRRHVH